MKAMKDFFKNEAAYIEYTLLYMSGEQRTSILNITEKHYSNKEMAKEWALNITSKISDEDALNEVLRIYRRMVGDANAELPTKAEPKAEPKAETETPEIMDESPVAYAARNGMKAFEEILNSYSLDQMKALIKAYKLDPNGILRRSKNLERVRTGIYSNVEARATHGNVFMNFEG